MSEKLPHLPPPDIWVREDFGLGDSTVHQGFTAEQVEEIRRQTIEHCAKVAEAHTLRNRRLYSRMNAKPLADCEIATALRALLETPHADQA